MSARRAFCHDCTHSRADTDAVWVWRPSPPHGGSGVVVALLDLREELFELPAQLLTRRERFFAREQRLVGATTERVVLLLEAGEHLAAVLFADLLLDVGDGLDLLGPQVLQIECQPRTPCDGLQQRDRRRRIVDLREIVGYVYDVPDRVDTPFTEPVLQHRLGTRGHDHLAVPQVALIEQILAGAVLGDDQGARMRHAHRDGRHTDGQTDVVALDQVGHLGGERLPPEVGFRAGEHEIRRTGVVTVQAYIECRRLVVGVVVFVEDHRRPAGAIVVELVDVEALQDFGVISPDVLRGQPRAGTSTEKAVESVQQHRPLVVAQLGQLLVYAPRASISQPPHDTYSNDTSPPAHSRPADHDAASSRQCRASVATASTLRPTRCRM